MTQKKPSSVTYRSYLLRFWQEGTGTPWRISLLAADDGVRRGFADLDHLVAYLQSQLEELESGTSDVESG